MPPNSENPRIGQLDHDRSGLVYNTSVHVLLIDFIKFLHKPI